MALIQCPECGKKDVSSNAKRCPNCGYPIAKKDHFQQKVPKESSNNKRVLFIAIVSVILLALICIIIIFATNRKTPDMTPIEQDTIPFETSVPEYSNDVTQEYSYDIDGFLGLDALLKWDMTKEEVEALDIPCDEKHATDIYVKFEQAIFNSKFTGSLIINFSNDVPQRITQILWSFEDAYAPTEIAESINQHYGDPVYKDNFNNKRLTIAKWMWQYDDQYVVLRKNNSNGDVSLYWGKIDFEIISSSEELLKNISNDNELKAAYETLTTRIAYLGGSIETAINDFNLSEYEITEAKYKYSGDYTYAYIQYLEKAELFGFEGIFKYRCDNPTDDDPPDFNGKIESIVFHFNNAISAEDAAIIKNKVSQLMGTEEINDSRYLPFEISYYDSGNPWMFLSINTNYYIINPAYGYDASEQEVPPYTDCDANLLPIPIDTEKHPVNLSTFAAEECWNLSMEAVKNNLKAPSTAVFPYYTGENVLILRTENTYELTSYVDAENSFGANIRTYFVVTLTRTGNKFYVTNVVFD